MMESMPETFAEEITQIQSRGTLTIPKKIRLSIGLKDNSLVRIGGNKYRLYIEPVRALPYPVRSYGPDEIVAFFALDAQETKDLRKKGLL